MDRGCLELAGSLFRVLAELMLGSEMAVVRYLCYSVLRYWVLTRSIVLVKEMVT